MRLWQQDREAEWTLDVAGRGCGGSSGVGATPVQLHSLGITRAAGEAGGRGGEKKSKASEDYISYVKTFT